MKKNYIFIVYFAFYSSVFSMDNQNKVLENLAAQVDAAQKNAQFLKKKFDNIQQECCAIIQNEDSSEEEAEAASLKLHKNQRMVWEAEEEYRIRMWEYRVAFSQKLK